MRLSIPHGASAASSRNTAPAIAVPKSLTEASPMPPREAPAAAPSAIASATTGWAAMTVISTSVVLRATPRAAGQIRTAYTTGTSAAIR